MRQSNLLLHFLRMVKFIVRSFGVEECLSRKYLPTEEEACLCSGAPNENVVQIHLNIALLNVFLYLTVDMGIFLSPKIFLSVRIS